MLTNAQLDRIEGDALALITAGAPQYPWGDAELDPSRLAAVAGAIPQLLDELRAARDECRAPERAALDAALDGDTHAVAALLADLPLDRLRALAFATQFLSTAAHNRALARLMSAAGVKGVDPE